MGVTAWLLGVVAASCAMGGCGGETVYKFTTEDDKVCSEDHKVCVYGMCCAEGDPGLQCAVSELPRWAPQSMQLESRCNNGGLCMRRLVDTGDASIIEVDESMHGGRCVPTPKLQNSRQQSQNCKTKFVPGNLASCTEPEEGRQATCRFIPPFDAEFGTEHVDNGEEDRDGVPRFDPELPAQVPGVEGAEATQMWARYCRCPQNFYGALCEMEMDPYDVILYALFSLASSTCFFAMMLAHRDATGGQTIEFGRYFRNYLMVAPGPESRTALSQNDVDQRMLIVAVMVGAFEQLMMVAGALSRSVAWSRNFVLVEILQEVFLTLIDLFSTLSALILPDTWTTANTFQIQVIMTLPLPIHGAVEFFRRRNEAEERAQQTRHKLRQVARQHRMSPPDVAEAAVERERQVEADRVAAEAEARLRQFRWTAVLPLLVIPVAGCLFKPVVGCNFLATSMNPQLTGSGGIQPQDSSARPPPDEELFTPKSTQLQCSYGSATSSFYWLGVSCFLPFWIFALAANTQRQSQKSVFALHTGYRAWHTQLQICCAMAWRSFSGANPTALTFLLTILIAIEVTLSWRWQPSNVKLINQARFQGSILALLWGLCGCVAAVVNDRADDRSGILVILTTSVWLAAVGFSNRKVVLAMCCCVLDRRLAPTTPSVPRPEAEQGPMDGVLVGRLQSGQQDLQDGSLSSSLIDEVARVEGNSSSSYLAAHQNEEIVDAAAVHERETFWDGQMSPDGDSL